MRIGLRLLIGFFLIVGLALVMVMRVFVQEVKPGTRLAMEDSLIDAAYALAELAQSDMKAGAIASGAFAQAMRRREEASPNANLAGFKKQALDYRITITDAKGIVRFDSAGQAVGQDHSRWNDVYLTLRGRYGARSTLADPDDPDSSVMHVAAPIMDGPRLLGVLTVSKPNQTLMPYIERSQQRIWRWSWVLLGGALAIGLLFSWWIARSLSRLQRYAQAVAQGQRAQLPPIGRLSGHTEFVDLAQAVESMRLKLEDKAYVENYVHTLTHELKSPLAAIQGAAELLHENLPEADRQRFAQRITQQTERLRLLIERLLTLASIEQMQRAPRLEPLDATALTQRVLAALEPRWQPRGLSVHTQWPPQPLTVQADPLLLELALTNLLDNAIDFAPPGSALHLSLQAQAGSAQWRVRDHGPGVPSYALARIFERFYSLPRPGTQDKSSGLGLCLVHEVAALHHGQVEVRNVTEDGAPQGCEALLRLPLA